LLSRSTILLLLFFVPTCLYSQSTCAGITFTGTKEASLFNGSDYTVLVRQPDGSYYGGLLQVGSLEVGNLYSNYQNVVLTGCAAAATLTKTLPSLPENPPAPGVASQILAMADFLNVGNPSAVFSYAPSPAPQVTFANSSKFPAMSTAFLSTSSGVATLATGDFNKDGNYDFAAVVVGDETAANPGGVQIFLGNGDGTFKTGKSYATGANALHVAVADLNSDGNLDLVVSGDGTSAISVLLGNGDGTFRATPATPMAGQGPVGVIAADFNNDKILDLGVANEDGTVSIFLGKGDGSFQTPMSSPCGADCVYPAAGDFNGDGKVDLAVTNLDGNLVSILLGNGDGTFGAPSFYAAGTFPTSLIVTDFNNDGKLDILVATGTPDYIFPDFGSGNMYLLLGNGDGTFQGTQLISTGGQSSRALAIADLNGDGKADVVVANFDSQNLTVFLGQGNGEFQAKPTYSLNASPVFVVAADFNGDGNLDVATVEQYAQSVEISLGNGDGTFQPPTPLAAGAMPVAAAVGDLNGDGKPDLVVADNGSQLPGSTDSGAVLVFLSNGSTFLPAQRFAAGSHPSSVAIQDVNLDGKPDLLVSDSGQTGVNDTGGASVLLGIGAGSFGAAVSYTTGTSEESIAVADVNGDGKPDLVLPALSSNFADEVLIFLGKGDGTFLAPSSLMASQPNSNVIVGDFNGDGKPDLILANCCGDTSMSYFLGNGDGAFQPEALFNGGPNSAFVASADFNNDGKPDLAVANDQFNGAISILLNTTPPPPTNMTADSSATPQSAPAGSAFANPLAVTVTDSAGHPVAGVSVTFTAPSSGASGTFPGGGTSFTTSTNSSGIATAATFTANANAGTYTVTAASAGLPTVGFALTNTGATTHPAFFNGEVFLGGNIYYLQFPDTNLFGYYGYLSGSILYHLDMGYEAFIAATGGQIYFYDFASGHWWYSSASLFPYLYDFTLSTFIYYFPNTTNPGHYTTNPRYFSNLTTGKIFTM
jgi:hypothetical protein